MDYQNIIALILCAGKGTRMGEITTNKVCCKIAGTSVIRRQLENLRLAGVSKYLLVVGDKATDVMNETSDIPGVMFAFQKEQKGTADAVNCGLKALKSFGISGDVFIIMGDKIMSVDVICALLNNKEMHKDTLTLAVQPKEHNKSGGRVIIDNQNVLGIIEMADSYLIKLSEVDDSSKYEDTLLSYNINQKKIAKIISKANSVLHIDPYITIKNKNISFDEIENSKYVYAGSTIINIEKCADIITKLDSNNVQGEKYFTDVVKHSAPLTTENLVIIEDKSQVLTYSTQEELKELETYFN